MSLFFKDTLIKLTEQDIINFSKKCGIPTCEKKVFCCDVINEFDQIMDKKCEINDNTECNCLQCQLDIIEDDDDTFNCCDIFFCKEHNYIPCFHCNQPLEHFLSAYYLAHTYCMEQYEKCQNDNEDIKLWNYYTNTYDYFTLKSSNKIID